MTGSSHVWTDVWVEDLEDRLRLQTKALFFIPAARELAIEHHLNNAGLASLANVLNKDRRSEPLAGIAVIRSVLGSKQPVSYDSALRFLRLLNHELPENRHLSTRDILACVFRLRDTEIIEQLGVTPDMIAKACNLSLALVKSAIKRMRINYRDAHDIWVYLSAIAVGKAREGALPDAVASVLTGDERAFILTDTSDNYSLAVEKIGPSIPKHSKARTNQSEASADYVYSRGNLRFAPPSGHHWAIDPDVPPAPAK